jgi:hypothetical protein
MRGFARLSLEVQAGQLAGKGFGFSAKIGCGGHDGNSQVAALSALAMLLSELLPLSSILSNSVCRKFCVEKDPSD